MGHSFERRELRQGNGVRGEVGFRCEKEAGGRCGGGLCLGWFAGDGGPEAKAKARNGFEVGGRAGGIAQGDAEATDGAVEALVEVDVGSFAPEALPEGVAGDDLAGSFEEGEEDLEGLFLKGDADAFAQ